MRALLFPLGLAAVFFLTPALAQAPKGYEETYNEPTNVNLGGRWVVADIALYVDPVAAEERDLRLALVTDVTEFIEETEQDLKNWVATNQDRCGNRWAAGEPEILFPEDAIRFVLDLELEIWNCGLRGQSEPGMLTHEAGRIDVTLVPYIEDGKLQARLSDFSVNDREGISRYLPLEFVAKQVINSELKKLNDNRKFYRAPQPFYASGFRYDSIEAQKTNDDHVIITARYNAVGTMEAMEQVVEKVRADGVTQ